MSAKRGKAGANPLAFLFSVKGVALGAAAGYLWIAQRELLLSVLGLILKYPVMLASFVVRTTWSVALKPVLRKVLMLRSGGAAPPVGELPGGSY